MTWIKSLRSGVRYPVGADHRLVVLCNDSVAPAADIGVSSSGSFTVSNGTPTFNQVGIFDGSIDFKRNGGNADEALVGPSSPTFSSGVTALTLMAWVYQTGALTTAGWVVTKQRNTTYGADTFVLGLGLNALGQVVVNGQGLTPLPTGTTVGSKVPLNEWNHVACTYDGTTLISYLNGVVQDSLTDTSGLDWGDAAAQARPWWIGNSPFPTTTDRRGFVGRIADVRAIARVLTASELRDYAARAAVGPTTDWIAYVPVLSSSGTQPNLGVDGTAAGKWRRVGDSIELMATFTFQGTGVAAGTGNYNVGLPSGLTIDSAKLPLSDSSGFTGYAVIGEGYTFDSGTSGNRQGATAVYDNGSIRMLTDAANSAIVAATVPFPWAVEDAYFIHCTVPIVGW